MIWSDFTIFIDAQKRWKKLFQIRRTDRRIREKQRTNTFHVRKILHMNHNAVNLISPTDCVERENVYCSACLKQWHASTRVEGKRKRGVRVAGRRDACVNLRFIALATATLIVVPFSLSHRAQSPFHLSLSTYGYSHFPFLPTSVSVPLVAFLPST